ncbi:MAG: Uma2 family endonuclease [Pseudonocardiaceae bacterium]
MQARCLRPGYRRALISLSRGDADAAVVQEFDIERREFITDGFQLPRAAANPCRLEAADVLAAVEIISPGTGTTHRVTKRYEYADAGIPHYWLVDLDEPVTLTAYTLVDRNYEHVAADIADTVTILKPSRNHPHPRRAAHPVSTSVRQECSSGARRPACEGIRARDPRQSPSGGRATCSSAAGTRCA